MNSAQIPCPDTTSRAAMRRRSLQWTRETGRAIPGAWDGSGAVPASRTGEVLGVEPPPPWSQVGREPARLFALTLAAGMRGACFQGGRPGHQVTARPCLFRPPQPQPSPVGVQIFSPRTVRKTASTISSSGWSLRASARAESCEGASTMTRFPDPSVTPKYTMAIPVL